MVVTSRFSGYAVISDRHSLSSVISVTSAWVLMFTLKTNLRDRILTIYLDSNRQQSPLRFVPYTPSVIYGPAVVNFRVMLRNECERPGCFHLGVFSYHYVSQLPQKILNGLFNCSVKYYSSFKPHIACDLKHDCENKQDEAEHCSGGSAECHGLVRSCQHCYSLHDISTRTESDDNTSEQFRELCHSLGGSPGFPRRSLNEMDELQHFYDLSHELNVFTGVHYDDTSLPNMYRNSIVDENKFVFHHTLHKDVNYCRSTSKLCVTLQMYYYSTFGCKDCGSLRFISKVFCEFTLKDPSSHKVKWPTMLSKTKRTDLVKSTEDQMTFMFLFCNPDNQCDDHANHNTACSFYDSSQELNSPKPHRRDAAPVPLFRCAESKLSFSQVCDFITDCPDRSDEAFCQHSPCVNQFSCHNGQCVSYDKWCDAISDCLDGSDFKGCREVLQNIVSFDPYIPSPVLVDFNAWNVFHSIKMAANESCLETHYRCPGELNDCLPVYTRCNGLNDCAGYEDEQNCQMFICPGLFRCRYSTICLHVDHLCDGWPHCPFYDDELTCQVICPVQCRCHAYSFLCFLPFDTHKSPWLRYVDATGTNMTLANFQHNIYLIHLILAHCSLKSLPAVNLPNLMFLDLSSNKLQHINTSFFVEFRNLQALSLARNPVQLLRSASSKTNQQSSLKTLDLSHTELHVFDSKPLSSFQALQVLNLSFISAHTISDGGFRFIPNLRELYLDGSHIETFPLNMYQSLSALRIISVQSYKLCCSELLPAYFDQQSCEAPRDALSSCKDLIQSVAYRGFLWLVCALSLAGNLFCFTARVWTNKVSSSGFSVFVVNLTVADFIMGSYIAVIGTADDRFRGKYLLHDTRWRTSMACTVAGCLCVLSSEVSALTVWLITLDRFIVLRFPFSTLRFSRTSGTVACLITWIAGACMATFPVLPSNTHWEFYSQTSICIPLSVTDRSFEGRGYSFGLLIGFNCVLFLFISCGQALIYQSVQRNEMTTDATKRSHVILARRLITIAVTDFLCWFPIGLCGLLALGEAPLPEEVNVVLVVFILPLNSALNPFLYTFNSLADNKRKSNQAKMARWLETNSGLWENLSALK